MAEVISRGHSPHTEGDATKVQSDLYLLGTAGGLLKGGLTPTRGMKNAKKNYRLAQRHEWWGDVILEMMPFQGRKT